MTRFPHLSPITAALAVLITVLVGCDRAGPNADRQTTAPAEAKGTSPPAANAGDSPAPAAPAAPSVPGPHITFTAQAHDFGRITDARELYCSFPFTNTGDAPLVISSIRSNCGCATATLEEMTYPPGEGAVLEVSYRPNAAGPQEKKITVISNARPSPLATLLIHADVTPVLTFDPPGIARGDLRVGQVHRETFRVWSRDPDMTVKSVGSKNPFVTLRQLGSSDPVAEGLSRVYEVEATISSRAPWGEVNALLSVTVRGRFGEPEPLEHTASISLNVMLCRELIPSRARFVVATVRKGDPFRKSIRLTRREGAPFTILSADVRNSTLPDMAVNFVNVVKADDYTYELILTGSTGDHVGPIRGQVVIETDVPGEERFVLQVVGVVQAP